MAKKIKEQDSATRQPTLDEIIETIEVYRKELYERFEKAIAEPLFDPPKGYTQNELF